jgi:hypothetical protein
MLVTSHPEVGGAVAEYFRLTGINRAIRPPIYSKNRGPQRRFPGPGAGSRGSEIFPQPGDL